MTWNINISDMFDFRHISNILLTCFGALVKEYDEIKKAFQMKVTKLSHQSGDI